MGFTDTPIMNNLEVVVGLYFNASPNLNTYGNG